MKNKISAVLILLITLTSCNVSPNIVNRDTIYKEINYNELPAKKFHENYDIILYTKTTEYDAKLFDYQTDLRFNPFNDEAKKSWLARACKMEITPYEDVVLKFVFSSFILWLNYVLDTKSWKVYPSLSAQNFNNLINAKSILNINHKIKDYSEKFSKNEDDFKKEIKNNDKDLFAKIEVCKADNFPIYYNPMRSGSYLQILEFRLSPVAVRTTLYKNIDGQIKELAFYQNYYFPEKLDLIKDGRAQFTHTNILYDNAATDITQKIGQVIKKYDSNF